MGQKRGYNTIPVVLKNFLFFSMANCRSKWLTLRFAFWWWFLNLAFLMVLGDFSKSLVFFANFWKFLVIFGHFSYFWGVEGKHCLWEEEKRGNPDHALIFVLGERW